MSSCEWPSRVPDLSPIEALWALQRCEAAGRLLPLRAATREVDAQRGEASGAEEASGRLGEEGATRRRA